MQWKNKSLESIAAILEAYTDSTTSGPWQLAYSGGKDSTVTAAQVIRAMLMLKPDQRDRKIYITSADTGIDLTTYPTKITEFHRMEHLIRQHDLPVEIAEVRAPIKDNMIFLILGLGYPLPAKGRQWCTERMKILPQRQFVADHNPILTLLGVRASETVARGESVKKFSISKYFGENGTMMPIVDFTLDDIWGYLSVEKTPWGDAEEISALYKEATGECGLRKRKAGAGEKVDDPCGARFGCIICPLITIDKSTRQISKTRPWYEPYAELRDIIINMYKDPRNKAGYRRDGGVMFYGEGTFNIRARRELFEIFMQAQEDNALLARLHGVQPQPILTDELIAVIQQQWLDDERDNPYLADAPAIGLLYETRPKGVRGDADKVIGQIAVNFDSKEDIEQWAQSSQSTKRR